MGSPGFLRLPLGRSLISMISGCSRPPPLFAIRFVLCRCALAGLAERFVRADSRHKVSHSAGTPTTGSAVSESSVDSARQIFSPAVAKLLFIFTCDPAYLLVFRVAASNLGPGVDLLVGPSSPPSPSQAWRVFRKENTFAEGHPRRC